MDALNRTYYEHGCEIGSGMDALNRTSYEHGCYYGSGKDALNPTSYEQGCYYGSGMDAPNRTYYEHGCFYSFGVGVCHACGGIHAMRVAAAFLSPRQVPKCCSCHAGQSRRAWARTHFLRVYGPSEPITRTPYYSLYTHMVATYF